MRADRAEEVKAALNAVSAKLTTAAISDMLKQTDIDKKDPKAVAAGVPHRQRPGLTPARPSSERPVPSWGRALRRGLALVSLRMGGSCWPWVAGGSA